MANNPYVNKVEYGGQTLIDISGTTAVESDVASGKVFHKADGSSAIGTGTLATACDMYVEDDTGIQTGDLYIDYEESSARQGLINTIWEFHTDITGQYDGTVYSITGTATNGTYTCNAIYQIGNLSYAGVNFFCLWQTGSDNIFAYVPPNGIGLTAGWSWANLQSATASPTAKPTLTITGGSDVGSATLEALLNVIADDLTPSSGGSKLYRKTSGGYTLLQDELPFSVPVEITEANLQSKSVSITSSGSQTVTADAGYDGLASVVINTNVPQPSGTTTITENGTYDVGSYASAVVNVSGSVAEAEYKDVNFYDYDGTRLYSYTASEFASLSSMPQNPTHDGLISNGWNWSLVNAKTRVAQIGFLDIGQMYSPSDGKSHFYITLDDSSKLSPNVMLVLNGSATIWWGDGTSSNITGTSTSVSNAVYTAHTYSSAGDYEITIAITSGTCKIWSTSSLKSFINGHGSNTNYYNNCLRHAVIDDDLFLDDYGLSYATKLEDIIIGRQASIEPYSLLNCYSLKCLIPQTSVTTIYSNITNYCNQLKAFCLNAQANFTSGIVFAYCCYALKQIYIPFNISAIASNACRNNNMQEKLAIPYNVTQINANAFYGLINLRKLVFLGTTPPTVAATSAFTSLNTECVIYVPSASLNAYKSATNYPSTSTYTYVGY